MIILTCPIGGPCFNPSGICPPGEIDPAEINEAFPCPLSRPGIYKYRIVRECMGVALLTDSMHQGAQYTVVEICRQQCRVYSALPEDLPTQGGRWFELLCDNGIDEVASWHPRSHALAVYNAILVRRGTFPWDDNLPF